MLKVTNREWPDDFPLQDFIDYRQVRGFTLDELPTSDDLEELRSGREEDESFDETAKDELADPAQDQSESDKDEDDDQAGQDDETGDQ